MRENDVKTLFAPDLGAEPKYKEVKHVVRFISRTGLNSPDGAFVSVQIVDAYLTELLSQGWNLYQTHSVGGPNADGFGVLYILVR